MMPEQAVLQTDFIEAIGIVRSGLDRARPAPRHRLVETLPRDYIARQTER